MNNNVMEPIYAKVGPKFLDKVDRVFDASPTTVFNELIQNSRRAGASSISIDIFHPEKGAEGIRLRYRDNGVGIEDPAVLLNLSESQWGPDSQKEDPAGMGFFCLSSFDSAEVSSRDWSMRIGKAAFRGEEAVQPCAAGSFVDGVEILWRWGGDDMSVNKLEDGIGRAAKYCGVPLVVTHFDGADPGNTEDYFNRVHYPPMGYLDDCDDIRDFPELGCRIGTVEGRYPFSGNTSGVFMFFNFHGVRVKHDEPWGGNHHSNLRRVVRVDVYDATKLPLVLPARNAIQHNDTFAKVCREGLRSAALYYTSKKYGKHTQDYKFYRHLRDNLDVDIGEAKPEMRGVDGKSLMLDGMDNLVILGDYEGEKTTGAQIVGDMMPLSKDDTFDYTLLRPKNHYEGYSWYDAIPVVNNTVTILDGVEKDLSDLIRSIWAGPNRDESIEVWNTMEKPILVRWDLSNGESLTAQLPYLIAFESSVSYWDCFDEVAIFIAPEFANEKSIPGLVSSLLARLFEASDDVDSDNWETQMNQFEQDCTRSTIDYLAGEKGSVAYVINQNRMWGAYREGVGWRLDKPMGSNIATIVRLSDKDDPAWPDEDIAKFLLKIANWRECSVENINDVISEAKELSDRLSDLKYSSQAEADA